MSLLLQHKLTSKQAKKTLLEMRLKCKNIWNTTGATHGGILE